MGEAKYSLATNALQRDHIFLFFPLVKTDFSDRRGAWPNALPSRYATALKIVGTDIFLKMVDMI